MTVSPASIRSVAGDVKLGTAALVAAASFVVSGEPEATYSIALPASVDLRDGQGAMTLTHFTSHPDGIGTLDATGHQVLTVGATLRLPPGGSAGTTSVIFHVTVTYN